MKTIIKYTILLLALPVLLQAQYSGSDGSGDTYISLTNVHLPVHKIESEIPTKYELNQNYPNPFNPRTVIRCQLPVVGNALLKVYDVQGREVQTLVNERLQPGMYEVMFDGSMLNSGVYLYKLITNGFSETKRMLLIK